MGGLDEPPSHLPAPDLAVPFEPPPGVCRAPVLVQAGASVRIAAFG
jgi:hypothetical protein